MKLIGFQKVRDGKYLKNYELTYLNRANKEKKYEIVSRRELHGAEDLGLKASGLSMIAFCEGKLLLLHEFRMGVNRRIYNLCAGMLEEGETVEECVKRELFEETGLRLMRIRKVLAPSYAAVAISDISTMIAVVDVEGTIRSEYMSSNEEIHAAFYSKEEVEELFLANEPFSSRAQLAAYFFTQGCFDRA